MKSKDIRITEIPFNKHIHLQPSDKPEYLFMLKESAIHLNHLSTYHAGVLFSLGESTSGEFLLRCYADLKLDIVPVIRRAEIKYSKPGRGSIYCKVGLLDADYEQTLEQLRTRGRTLLKVRSDLYDDEGSRIAYAVYEWLVTVIRE